MLADYSWTWGLPWSVGRARVGPLKKTAFLWSSSYQFWIALCPGMGWCGHFPAPCWNFICLGLAQVFCMLPQSLRVHVCISPVLSSKAVSVKSSTTSGAYQCSALSSAQIPETWGHECDTNVPFVDEHPKVFLHFVFGCKPLLLLSLSFSSSYVFLWFS